MVLSIVTTMYHSAAYLQEFHEKMSQYAKQITDAYEFVFVNDGSPDNSLEVALRIQEIKLEFQNKPNAEELDVNLCNDILIAMEKEKNAVFAYFDKVSNTFKDIYYISLLQSNIYERQASYD